MTWAQRKTKPGRCYRLDFYGGNCQNNFLHACACVRVCVSARARCCVVVMSNLCSPPPPMLLVFGMDHRAKNGSWDLILPTIKSPELLSNCRYSVYCVLWTTANIYAFIQHTHGLTLLQANTHTRTKTHTSAGAGTERGKQSVQNLTNKELLN